MLLDVKGTFIELEMGKIYNIFSGLFYSVLTAIGILAENCNKGIEKNLIAFAESAPVQNMKGRTTKCEL